MSRLDGVRCGAVIAVALILSFTVAGGSAHAASIESVLTEAYGPEVAARCRDYLDERDLPQEEASAVREAVRFIADAGYPGESAEVYLRLAADLSEAGIGPGALTNKIREGIAKGTDAARMMHVLQRKAGALKEAMVLVLQLEREDVRFVDRQMACTVLADYLLRGVKGSELAAAVRDGDLERYPALTNVLR